MTGASEPRVRFGQDGAIAILTLARPDKLNALDEAAIGELGALCQRIERDETIRAVILTGEGGKAFSAGGDIGGWSGKTPLEFGRFWLREGHAVFDALARLRQPLIAVLNGHALGGGLELAAAADLRIAESHVKLGLPEAGLGIIPGWSGTQRAVRRFGAPAIRRMALFGEVFEAQAALELGLVDVVVATGEGMAEAKRLAAKVCERAPVATELTKMLINAAEGEERERVLETMAGMFAASTEDLAEGVAAFRDKRRPDFSGR
ncbi:enoyl-CoA hydratase/isomerase family protein [Kaistia defluvii]|uniref:enoyl-CoA hydratase/isomerase family protein n=1 Tax=Kaistia defluvii TaxID=410841 RepID=UPI002257C294|nr:enoyl-CoA hydratase/isomerase family protein [Kaistia defluvii]MCX5518100.1 enoyl-CoA hydratase/isomerase family protein [Kaistia defluvii]